MLRQEDNQGVEDDLPNITEDNAEEFATYKKNIDQNYKSRAQKNKQRVQRLTKHVWDPQTKKQRRQDQKAAAKVRLHQVIDQMTKQEARTYLQEKKEAKKIQKKRIRQAMQTGRTIMIDLVYENKMNEKENASLGKQVQLVMKAIKAVKEPPSIHLCSFGGKAQQKLKKMGYQHWAVTTHKQNVLQIGSSLGKRLIYLSPDATDDLGTIESNDAFILGGLIDRTVIKEASLQRAKQLGIEARKLPIKDFMKGRLCLNLDHVISMICKFQQTNDWKIAFDYAAPKRWKKQLEACQQKQKQQQKFHQAQEQNIKKETKDQQENKLLQKQQKIE